MKVDIIMPCYNGAKYLDKCLNSVLNQSFQNITLYFVNDGSSDETEKIAMNYKKIFENNNKKFVYLKKENGGAASAINVALKQKLDGKYLLIMDSDDILPEDSIEIRVQFLEENKNYGAVYGYLQGIDCESNNIVFLAKNKGISDNIKKTFMNILLAQRITYSGYLFKEKEFFDVVGTHIFESKYGQNWQILLPFSFKYKIKVLPKIVYKYIVIKTSHSHDNVSNIQKVQKYLASHREILYNTLKNMGVLEDYEKYIDIYRLLKMCDNSFLLNERKIFNDNYKNLKKIYKIPFKLFVKKVLINFNLRKFIKR